ncbi:lipopolysaccharide assembly protein LapB [Gemella sp. zg-1178]|uniref:tetratricopeptide repeat protein n=1 Tax=Gemella sp. zg-1178 TaxID=2840372 RepID=UPI001C05DFF9|nr:slei family protein [Gemella sp. zg-1178]MBU0279013.1 slei family protein [Gemella sp. zg-1178]
MDIEQFLKEYENIDINFLERGQLEVFREIFFEHGMLDKALEVSEVIYENNKEDEGAIVSYVDNLMHLGKKDEALMVLFNAEKTAQILLLEGLIYKYDFLFDVAEEKFKQAKLLVKDDEDLKALIDVELANVYVEVGRGDDALELSYKMFNENNNIDNFIEVTNNLLSLGKFEDVVDFYNQYGIEYEDAEIYFSLAYAHNQLKDLDKSKEFLLKRVALDNENLDAYMHLGFMSKGQEAIKYLEKYLDLQGLSKNVYIQLTSLYKQEKRYNDIRTMVKEILTIMGIDNDSLYIAINALKELYEAEKVFEIYQGYDIIKEDSSLLALALLALSEEEDYADFVEKEIKKHRPFLYNEATYPEILSNVYELTASATIKRYLHDVLAEQAMNSSYENFNNNHTNSACSCDGENCDECDCDSCK